jgi:hypothetical protein
LAGGSLQRVGGHGGLLDLRLKQALERALKRGVYGGTLGSTPQPIQALATRPAAAPMKRSGSG